MSRHFAELAFTAAVKQEQERHGSRHQHEQVEHDGKGLTVKFYRCNSR